MWRKEKPLPAYCFVCGCPMEKRWKIGRERFDEQTGVGSRTDEAIWACSSGKDDSAHFWVDIPLAERSTIAVTSKCAARQEGEPNGESKG